MILREAIQKVKGFRYMVDQLNIRSAVGRRLLYDMVWLTSGVELNAAFEQVNKGICLFEREADVWELVGCKLVQLRDVRGSVKRTAGCEVLDDLELFEIKYFALLLEELREMVKDWDVVNLPDLQAVVHLLDPESNGIPHFYIYDAYSFELAALRIQMKSKQWKESDRERMYAESVELEDRIRAELSEKLRPFYAFLQQALHEVGLLDLVMAKVEQVKTMQLVCPEMEEEDEKGNCFKGLFHPQLRVILEAQGKIFQAIDLDLVCRSTVITGANMAGKTVLLKTVELAQYLMQFGFFVPASQARMRLVDEVEVSTDDEQDELNGLSSYAAEILRVNEIVAKVKAGRKVLVLIDELARTTNPLEGRAIVNGVVEFLTIHQTMALVTTHYGGITAVCCKLRVRGFVENRVVGGVTPGNINDFIDYTLLEDFRDEVPHEAMRIARMLGVDSELVARTENYLRRSDAEKEKTVQ